MSTEPRQAGTTMRHTTRARTLLTALAALAATAALAACNPADQPTPTPTPTVSETASPTPTATATLSEKDQNIADAKATYLAWIKAYDAAAQAGFVNGDLLGALLDLTGGGEARSDIVSAQVTFEEFGLEQTGDSVVRSVVVTEYQEDATGGGMHGVKLRACLDLSNVDFVYSDGSSSSTGDYRGPRNVYVLVLHQTGGWAVQSAEPQPEERC